MQSARQRVCPRLGESLFIVAARFRMQVSLLGTFLALPWANTVLLLGWFVLVEALQVCGCGRGGEGGGAGRKGLAGWLAGWHALQGTEVRRGASSLLHQ